MKIFFSLLLLFVFNLTSAQVVTLQGKVLDAQTGKGIPYVNMGLPQAGIGTSANEVGEFILKIGADKLSDTLVFSCMGYVSFKIKGRDLAKQTLPTVLLSAVNINLAEFTFSAFDGNKILKEVLKKRASNYATEPTIIQAFCREVIKNTDSNQYFVESEGVLETYKASVKKNTDQVRLLKGRKKNLSNYFMRDTVKYVIPKITNAPAIGVLLDIVKTPEFFIEGHESYQFTHEGYESIHDRLAYKIQFSTKNPEQAAFQSHEVPFFEGTVYIDTASFAVVRADFIVNRLGRGITNRSFHPIHMPLKLLNRHYTVNYSLKNDKWFFHSAIVDNRYVYHPNLLNISSKIEYFTTHIRTDSIKRFAKAEIITHDEMLVDNISEFDDSFWGEYNFVKSSNASDSLNTPPSVSAEVNADRALTTANAKTKTSKNGSTNQFYLSTNSVKFYKISLDEAFKLAAEQGKNVFIDAYANWCMPCKKMDAEAFHDQRIADKMNGFFINLKVDVEGSGRDIAMKYNIKFLPTVMILNPQGVIIEQFQGYSGINFFDNQISNVINRVPKGFLYLTTHEKFEKNKWHIDNLELYAQVRRSLGLSTDIITNALVSKLPVDTLILSPYQQFLFNYSQDLDSKTVDFFLKNRQISRFEHKLKALIQQNLYGAILNKDRNLLKQVLNANKRFKTATLTEMKDSVKAIYEQENAELTTIYYRKTEEYKAYHEATTELLEKFYLPNMADAHNGNKGDDLQHYTTKILAIAQFYNQHIKEKKYLNSMMLLLQKATAFIQNEAMLSEEISKMNRDF